MLALLLLVASAHATPVISSELPDLVEKVLPGVVNISSNTVVNYRVFGMEDFLRTLAEIGYNGPLTVEREIPQDPERQKAEIGHAIRLLTELKQHIA